MFIQSIIPYHTDSQVYHLRKATCLQTAGKAISKYIYISPDQPLMSTQGQFFISLLLLIFTCPPMVTVIVYYNDLYQFSNLTDHNLCDWCILGDKKRDWRKNDYLSLL